MSGRAARTQVAPIKCVQDGLNYDPCRRNAPMQRDIWLTRCYLCCAAALCSALLVVASLASVIFKYLQTSTKVRRLSVHA